MKLLVLLLRRYFHFVLPTMSMVRVPARNHECNDPRCIAIAIKDEVIVTFGRIQMHIVMLPLCTFDSESPTRDSDLVESPPDDEFPDSPPPIRSNQ